MRTETLVPSGFPKLSRPTVWQISELRLTVCLYGDTHLIRWKEEGRSIMLQTDEFRRWDDDQKVADCRHAGTFSAVGRAPGSR